MNKPIPEMNIEIKEYGNIRLGHYEPGDGTSYRAIAVRWQIDEYQQVLGHVSDGWLIVNCLNCLAYLFQAEGFLTDGYIQARLGLGKGDYPYFGDLVRALIGR